MLRIELTISAFKFLTTAVCVLTCVRVLVRIPEVAAALRTGLKSTLMLGSAPKNTSKSSPGLVDCAEVSHVIIETGADLRRGAS